MGRLLCPLCSTEEIYRQEIEGETPGTLIWHDDPLWDDGSTIEIAFICGNDHEFSIVFQYSESRAAVLLKVTYIERKEVEALATIVGPVAAEPKEPPSEEEQ